MSSNSTPLALITGSAHRLGRTIALKLAAMGFDIALHYHRSRQLALQTAAEIERTGKTVHLLNADLTDPIQIERIFTEVANLPGQLSVLVNSAAVMPRATLLDMDTAAWDFTFNLNLRAPWLCARYAAPLMASGQGNIINLTDSGAGRMWTSYAVYSITKSALQTLTQLLARTLAPGIRVNAIAPGLVLPSPDMPAEEWNRLVERLPLKQAAQPEHIAHAVEYLLTNPHVTGQTLVVDGGYQLI